MVGDLIEDNRYMSDMKEAALEYAARGWPVFPIDPKRGSGKQPYKGSNGVLDATTDRATIQAWWEKHPEAMIALDVGGARMMVLDLDPGYDMEELEKNVGEIPKTKLFARSPRGGIHLFYRLKDGEYVPPSASKLAKHVDVRSFNSYVLLAPSKTASGSYTWEGNGEAALRSDDLLRAASAAKAKHKDRDKWIITADLPENVARAIDWLKNKAKIATQGQGGDHCTYATAAYLKSLGISQGTALDLMLEHWNPRCDPPWDPEDLEVKVENGYKYNSSPPGNLTSVYQAIRLKQLFTPVIADIPSGVQQYAGIFTARDREAMTHIKPPDWLIQDCIPDDGYAIMFGTFGTYKTFLALDMALSLARGLASPPRRRTQLSARARSRYREASSNLRRRAGRQTARGRENDDLKGLMWTPENQGAVLFCVGEGLANLNKRVEGWEQVHNSGKPVKDFVLVDPVPPSVINDEHLKGLIDLALKFNPNGYALTVIDTISRSMAGANENDQADATRFTALAMRLKRELGGSVLALHHTGVEDVDRPRGSSVFAADADTLLKVEELPNRIAKLTMVKQKDGEAWENPKHVKLSEAANTLVAVPASLEEIKKATPKTAESEFEREANVPYILAALNSVLGREWSVNKLAIACREKGCDLSVENLRRVVLGRKDGNDGWARSHPALSPYWNNPAETWITPWQPPLIPPQYQLDDSLGRSSAPTAPQRPKMRSRCR